MLTSVVYVCCLLVLLLGIYDIGLRRAHVSGIIQVVIAVLTFFLARSVLSTSAIHFGSGNEDLLITLLYLIIPSMCGAATQEYMRARKPTLRGILRAVVASPITIVPLYQLTQQPDGSSQATVSIILLAYQNGFFWRALLDRQQKQVKE